jgi:hypothetical protein
VEGYILERLLKYRHAYPEALAKGTMTRLCRYDRFQASSGIVCAAEYIATLLRKIGLSQVALHLLGANGKKKWWSFKSPLSWTPIHASLNVIPDSSDGNSISIRYPSQPLSLAAYSRSTPYKKLSLIEFGKFLEAQKPARETALLIDESSYSKREVFDLANDHDIRVLLICPMDGKHLSKSARGRIELPSDTKLTVFSLTRNEYEDTLSKLDNGRVSIEVSVMTHESAGMPLLEAVIPGAVEEELLVTAHLCHNSPGANDNVSGVVTAIAIAMLFLDATSNPHGPRFHRTVRFIFMPEFTGTSAYLHDFIMRKKRPKPMVVLNLDTTGGDLLARESCLIVERPPERLGHLMTSLIEYCLGRYQPQCYSYSGAIKMPPYRWLTTPSSGGSDHALYSDPNIGIPAIQIGYWKDARVHTDQDTEDHICWDQMRRVCSVAAAAIETIRDVKINEDVTKLADLVLKQNSISIADRLFRHSYTISEGLLNRLHENVENEIISTTRLSSTPVDQTDIRTILAGQKEFFRLLYKPANSEQGTNPKKVIRCWEGPFNCFVFLEQWQNEDSSKSIWCELSRKSLFLFCHTISNAVIDGMSFEQIVSYAKEYSQLPISDDIAKQILNQMEAVGLIAWSKLEIVHYKRNG